MRRNILATASLLALAACAGRQEVPEQLIAVPKATPQRAAPQGVEGGSNRTLRPMAPIYSSAVRNSGSSVLARLKAANAEASRDVFDGYFSGASLKFRWREGEVYNATMARNRSTTFGLYPGEGYVNAVFGDDRFFGLDTSWSGTKDTRSGAGGPASTQIPVIAYTSGHCTDLTIYTTWRTILLNLCSKGNASAYNKHITWTFPDDEAAAFAAGVSAPVPMEQVTGVPVDQLDTRYTFTGDPTLRPGEWKAMTDGRRRTYLVPPANLGFLPVPYLTAKGNGSTPQYEVKPQRSGDGSYIELISSPPPYRVVLQHGDKTMTVQRAGR